AVGLRPSRTGTTAPDSDGLQVLCIASCPPAMARSEHHSRKIPMSIRRLLFLYIAALLPLPALAQAPATCPELPASSGLSWESTQGDDFLFCKAVREDGFQAFSVMLREESTVRERFGLREEKGVIDGHKVRWYRGQ